MKIFDIVEYKEGKGFLVSGSGRYSSAVVASVQPFILYSLDADMRWAATIHKEDFIVVSEATDYTKTKMLERFSREVELLDKTRTRKELLEQYAEYFV